MINCQKIALAVSISFALLVPACEQKSPPGSGEPQAAQAVPGSSASSTSTSIADATAGGSTAGSAAHQGLQLPEAMGQSEPPADEKLVAKVPRASVADLQNGLADGSTIALDVRDQADYEGGHIRGAWHIPLADLDQRIAELPKGKRIIAYCT